MKKFIVKKGKQGYDFQTLADTAPQAIDIAWSGQGQSPVYQGRSIGPFSWWNIMSTQWGEDKWYVDELNIARVEREDVNQDD